MTVLYCNGRRIGMSVLGQKRTFNEDPISKCSAILASLETMVRAHAGCKRATALRGGPTV